MEKKLSILKALADENRLKIVKSLVCGSEKTCSSVSGFVCDLSQPTISHHIKILKDAGIIDARKEGTEQHYTLNHTVLEKNGIDIKKLL